MNQLNKAEALHRSILAAELDPQETQILADRMGVLTLRDGETLVSESEARHTLFVLVEGCIDVRKTIAGSEETVYRMQIGECAGTRAFVDGSERKAAMRSVGDSAVLTLEPADFESLLDTRPWLVYKVMRAIFRITHSNLMRVNMESAEMRKYMTGSRGRY